MCASTRLLAAVLVCLSNLALSSLAATAKDLLFDSQQNNCHPERSEGPAFCAQQSDLAAAERVLGPQWKQLSRRAGMIFAGTVLTPIPPTDATETATRASLVVPGPTPAIELSFRVDEPIAGVKRGQLVTIHEWTGACSMHSPMSQGQRILLFLYPPSRLGLTSPVGGSIGQVRLDSSGKNVSRASLKSTARTAEQHLPPQNDFANVTVVQLERAIRRARNGVE